MKEMDEEIERRRKCRERDKAIALLATTRALFNNPLPNTTFNTRNVSKTNPTSGHKEVLRTILGKLCIDQHMVDEVSGDLNRQSLFLETILRSRNTNTPEIPAGPQDLQSFIRELVFDVLHLLYMETYISVHSFTYVPHPKYFRSRSCDSEFLMVTTVNLRPVMPVLVKTPNVKGILNHPEVQGQIVDYMIDIASFYGQRDVFGVTTTGDEYRFHWLPMSNDTAQAAVTDDYSDVILTGSMPELTRDVCSTRVYKHNEEGVVRLLMSALTKSAYSPRYRVDLISSTRAYITLNDQSWDWLNLDLNKVMMDSLTLRLDDLKATTTFVVLNHLARSNDQLVWVALAGNTSNIVVLKQFTDADAAQRELRVWKTVNGQTQARVQTVRGLTTLIMPLVFEVKRHSGRASTHYLDCDLFNYVYADPAIRGVTPASLLTLIQAILDTATAMGYDNVRTLAVEAIESLAKCGVVHGDIEMRHFAAMAVFNADGSLQTLKAVMIDFSRITEGVEPAVALAQMQTVTNKLFENIEL